MPKHLLSLALLLFVAIGCKFGAENRTSAETKTTAVATDEKRIETPAENKKIQNAPEYSAQISEAQAVGEVCADPSKPCHHKDKKFDDWELSFKLPARIQANKTYESAPFYAIILKTYTIDAECDGGEYVGDIEAARRREQSNQLDRKVFASYQCPNMAAVQYEFEGKWTADKESLAVGNFLAIYAGKTQTEAAEALRIMKGEYPEAILKKMTATYERIQQ